MENATLPSGKLIAGLKVVTLKRELKKRQLSQNGTKAELVQRLAEGLNATVNSLNTSADETVVIGTSSENTDDTAVEQPVSRAQPKRKSRKRRGARQTESDSTADEMPATTPQPSDNVMPGEQVRVSSRRSRGSISRIRNRAAIPAAEAELQSSEDNAEAGDHTDTPFPRRSAGRSQATPGSGPSSRSRDRRSSEILRNVQESVKIGRGVTPLSSKRESPYSLRARTPSPVSTSSSRANNNRLKDDAGSQGDFGGLRSRPSRRSPASQRSTTSASGRRAEASVGRKSRTPVTVQDMTMLTDDDDEQEDDTADVSMEVDDQPGPSSSIQSTPTRSRSSAAGRESLRKVKFSPRMEVITINREDSSATEGNSTGDESDVAATAAASGTPARAPGTPAIGSRRRSSMSMQTLGAVHVDTPGQKKNLIVKAERPTAASQAITNSSSSSSRSQLPVAPSGTGSDAVARPSARKPPPAPRSVPRRIQELANQPRNTAVAPSPNRKRTAVAADAAVSSTSAASSSESATESSGAEGDGPRRKRNRTTAPASGNRFAAAHEQLLLNQPTLEEIDEQRRQRREQMDAELPDAFRRLATPTRGAAASNRGTPARVGTAASTTGGTRVGTPARGNAVASAARRRAREANAEPFRFNVTTPALEINFDIGDANNYAAAQQQANVSSASGSAARALNRIPLRKVKTPAEKRAEKEAATTPSTTTAALTVPLDTTMVNYLATSKGNKPPKMPKRKPLTTATATAGNVAGSVPKFRETQKLTDAEYVLAKQQGLLRDPLPDLSGLTDVKLRRQLENIKWKLQLE